MESPVGMDGAKTASGSGPLPPSQFDGAEPLPGPSHLPPPLYGTYPFAEETRKCDRCSHDGPLSTFPLKKNGSGYLKICFGCNNKQIAKKSGRQPVAEQPSQNTAMTLDECLAAMHEPPQWPVKLDTFVKLRPDEMDTLWAGRAEAGTHARANALRDRISRASGFNWNQKKSLRGKGSSRSTVITYYCAQLEGENTKHRLVDDEGRRRARREKMQRYQCGGWLHVTIVDDDPLFVRVRLQHDLNHPSPDLDPRKRQTGGSSVPRDHLSATAGRRTVNGAGAGVGGEASSGTVRQHLTPQSFGEADVHAAAAAVAASVGANGALADGPMLLQHDGSVDEALQSLSSTFRNARPPGVGGHAHAHAHARQIHANAAFHSVFDSPPFTPPADHFSYHTDHAAQSAPFVNGASPHPDFPNGHPPPTDFLDPALRGPSEAPETNRVFFPETILATFRPNFAIVLDAIADPEGHDRETARKLDLILAQVNEVGQELLSRRETERITKRSRIR